MGIPKKIRPYLPRAIDGLPVGHTANPVAVSGTGRRMPLPQATRDDFRTIESLFCDADNSDRTPIIGLGTGDLVAQLLQHVAETKPNLVFYPTSPSTKSELSLHPELSIDETASTVDIFVDQADQVDASGDEVWWTVNQGNNGPQVSLVDVPALKAAVSLSKKVVLLTRSRTTTGARLGGQLPVIIQGDEIEWEEIAEEVDDLFVTDAEITRRSHQEDVRIGFTGTDVRKIRSHAPTLSLSLTDI